MALYTERKDMREPVKRTSEITHEMYSYLFACCERYLINIAWKYPIECPDGKGVCGLDKKSFNDVLKFEIPLLFRDNYNIIAVPRKHETYNQYALLDYIEFIALNMKHIKSSVRHDYFSHDDMTFTYYNGSYTFKNDINNAFEKTGLLYFMNDNGQVERIIEIDALPDNIGTTVVQIPEEGSKKLITEAIAYYRKSDPVNRSIAVEKIWDALERLKTFYSPELDKKASVEKIISNIADTQLDFKGLLNTEFYELTKIGNEYRIRHHEIGKIDIYDPRHYDYFFNRCISLISLIIQYLK